MDIILLFCIISTAFEVMKQVAQLSQTDRTLLLVIEYVTKSLKVIRNDTVESGMCKSLLVLH